MVPALGPLTFAIAAGSLAGLLAAYTAGEAWLSRTEGRQSAGFGI